MTGYLILGGLVLVVSFVFYVVISQNKRLKKDNKEQKTIIEDYEEKFIKYGVLNSAKKNIDLQNKTIKEKLSTIDIDKYADSVQDAPKRTRKDKSPNS